VSLRMVPARQFSQRIAPREQRTAAQNDLEEPRATPNQCNARSLRPVASAPSPPARLRPIQESAEHCGYGDSLDQSHEDARPAVATGEARTNEILKRRSGFQEHHRQSAAIGPVQSKATTGPRQSAPRKPTQIKALLSGARNAPAPEAYALACDFSSPGQSIQPQGSHVEIFSTTPGAVQNLVFSGRL